MTKTNGAANLSADYATIRATYPHLAEPVVNAIHEAVLAGLPEGESSMTVIGPKIVQAYAWADIFCRSDILHSVMQGDLLIRVEEEEGEIRFEPR